MDSRDPSTSRRRFLKLLAASPLLSLPLLPEGVREALSGLAGSRLPDPEGAEEAFRERSFPPLEPARGRWEPVDTPDFTLPPEGQEAGLISSVEEAVNVFDFEGLARRNTRPEHWAYLATGVDDDRTLRANEEGYARFHLRARRLRDVRETDTSVELFGRRWGSPIFFCPVASLRAYHPEGEVGVARAARSRDALMMQSTVSSRSVEEINEALGRPVWFQLYPPRRWSDTVTTLRRVEDAGCEVLVWTVDITGGRNTETLRRALGPEGQGQPTCQTCHVHRPEYRKPMRRGLEGGPAGPGHVWPPTWDYLDRLKGATDMKVLVKGIVTAEDAEIAVERGADGVVVSNHGGRAEESLRPTIWDLPEVAAAVGGRIPVLFDGGVRRGTSVYKALALGADAVGIGRPYVWGLSGFGQEGVEAVFDLLQEELELVMRQMGTPSIGAISPDRLADGLGKGPGR